MLIAFDNEQARTALFSLDPSHYQAALLSTFKINMASPAQSMNQYLAKGRARALSGLKVPETYFERREHSNRLVMSHEIDLHHTFGAYIPQELEGLRKKFADNLENE